MADSSNVQIPWASLVVVATLVSGTLLAPRAFEMLRPAEKERAQALVGSDLEVDARLWEDPFAAMRRHEAERQQRCDKDKTSRECDRGAAIARRDPKLLVPRLDADVDGDMDEALVLAVMVPGNPFVGAEEARRRTRYAVLAGLQAERYLPNSAEHLGIFSLDLEGEQAKRAAKAQGASERPRETLLMPYELLSDRRALASPNREPRASTSDRARRPYRSVAVLWVDESALPSPKLDGLARVLNAALGACGDKCPSLALIGPSSSDGLKLAVARLNDLAGKPALAAALPDEVRAGLRHIAKARVFNTSATLEERRLDVPEETDLQTLVKENLRTVLKLEDAPLEYQRTIADDPRVVGELANELRKRFDADTPRRVVTIIESDPISTRPMERELRRRLADAAIRRRDDDRVFFFRGVDGVTVREGVDRSATAGKTAKDDDASIAIEWPESRDQLDYLRRMAAELQRSETIPVRNADGKFELQPIGAIGIFANDVHDKLLILQALHARFPDKVFFTTDMDARFLHPRVLPFTRNLVVATSLPLQFPADDPAPADTAASQSRTRGQLHAGTPPFRDVYQASTYVATRLAACVRNCDQTKARLNAALVAPTIYEIGRDGATALAGFDLAERRADEPDTNYRAVLGIGLLLVLAGLLLWPSTPALRAALGKPAADAGAGVRTQPPGAASTAALSAVYGALFGAMLASALEALWPGVLGFRGVLAWTAVSAGYALLLLPDLRRRDGVRKLAPGWGLRIVFVIVLAAFAWWTTGTSQRFSGEPLVWLQGISGWPSHFIHLLAVLVGLVTLDRLASMTRRARIEENGWLWRGEPASRVADAPTSSGDAGSSDSWWRRKWASVRERSLLAWKPEHAHDRVDFVSVWRQYQSRSTSAARVMRIAFWYLVTVVGFFVLFRAVSDLALPEVPVRGLEHRALIGAGMWLALLVLPLAVVAVADTTMLAWRLILALTGVRTAYPPQVVARFANELGPQHADAWKKPIAADTAMRASRTGPHSLLDDWIDIRLLARHTQYVAPLVVGPFLMLTLMVVARSRLFDNWSLEWPVAATAAIYVLWLGMLAVMLKLAAEKAREDALARMNADLRWLRGSDDTMNPLVEPMHKLIAAVESERRGAFAAPFDQWFFKALLVPLGGAGGAQLIERLLMAK